MYCIKGVEKIASVGTGYVDDVTLIATLEKNEEQTETNVRKRIRQMARTWEKLLYLTGGN